MAAWSMSARDHQHDALMRLRAQTRAKYLRTLSDAWRMAQEPDETGDPVEPPEPAKLSAAEARAGAYEQRKHELSRAWIAPRRALWGQTGQPKYWNEPAVDPVTTVMMPAAINPRKGAGPVTPAEIAEFRAAERAAFAERLPPALALESGPPMRIASEQ
jgi:hypothetical protein